MVRNISVVKFTCCLRPFLLYHPVIHLWAVCQHTEGLLCNFISEHDFNSVRKKVNSLNIIFALTVSFRAFIPGVPLLRRFAPGYQYFAHTGPNPNLHCKEFRITIMKLFFFKFAANLNQSECEGRQNARRRVRFDEIFTSFSSNGKGRASPA